jgi:competence ComEA-like helix-hairpin-helix protein
MVKMHASQPRWLLSGAFVILAGSLAIGASAPAGQAKKAPKPLPPALTKSVGELTPEEEEQFSNAAEQTIERVCIACHPFENITKTRRTPKEWSDQVTVMAQRGAPGTEPDFALVKKYLTRYYGLIRVNTATAEDLTAVLGLSPKAAAAVIEYRSAHGKIPDLDTLAKIDGVDKARLEEQPEALRFD